MKSSTLSCLAVALVFVAMTVASTSAARAQCSTCAQPTIAYSPVVAQPVVAYQQPTGWYLGRAFDRMRMRRYARNYGTAAAYTTAYAPYTAAYSPYTVGYAASRVAYRPYVTSYAPLARPVVQTAYYQQPVAFYSAGGCSTCVQTVARPVVVAPVVSACATCQVDPCACNSCSSCSSCGGCPSCVGSVGQASYSEPACVGCVGGAAAPQISGGSNIGPQTPQPALKPEVPAPGGAGHDTRKETPSDAGAGGNIDHGLEPKPIPEDEASTSFDAPQLLNPRDRTAQRTNGPSVDVRPAVYRQPATGRALRQTTYKPAAKTQAEIDAEGWSSVPRSR